MQEFQAIMEQRSLHWEGCTNVRDLGGLPLPNGAATKWGQIFRADFPGKLTQHGWESLAQAKIATIIDLRAPHEVEKESYVIPRQYNIQWLNRPMEKFLPGVSALISQANNRAEVYTIILDHYPDCIAQVLKAIAAEQDGAVLLHCQAGKDRTGTIAGLLLDLVGVPWEWIAADYAESQMRLAPFEAKETTDGSLSFWARPTATAEMMTSMLQHVHQTYQSTRDYLRFIGLKDDDIGLLRQKLISAGNNKG